MWAPESVRQLAQSTCITIPAHNPQYNALLPCTHFVIIVFIGATLVLPQAAIRVHLLQRIRFALRLRQNKTAASLLDNAQTKAAVLGRSSPSPASSSSSASPSFRPSPRSCRRFSCVAE
eukprot:gene2488-biopygen14085